MLVLTDLGADLDEARRPRVPDRAVDRGQNHARAGVGLDRLHFRSLPFEGRFLRQLVGPGRLDLGAELLGCLVPGELDQDVLVGLGLLEGELGFLNVQPVRGLLGLGGELLIEHPLRPFVAVLGALQLGPGHRDVAVRRLEVLLEDALLELLDGHLGHLARQLRLPVGCLGLRHGDLLVLQPLGGGGRVEHADDLPRHDAGSLGRDVDDRPHPLGLGEEILGPRRRDGRLRRLVGSEQEQGHGRQDELVQSHRRPSP